MIDLDAIEARLSAATKDAGWYVDCASGFVLNDETHFLVASQVTPKEAAFIAHAPEDIRALIAEVRTLRAQVEARPDITPELAARYLGNQMSITSYVRMTEMELQRKLREHARKVKL